MKPLACLTAALTLMALAAGCLDCSRQTDPLNRQIIQQKQQITQLNAQLAEVRAARTSQQQQIATLQQLGPGRLEKLNHVDRIQLASHSGGYQQGNQPGDQGIRVYLEPVDATGSVIKAAGEVTIELFDLDLPEGSNRIAACHFPVDEVAKHWHSGFLTYHYSFDCPWQAGPPQHDKITLRVSFVDYLTGKTFVVQKEVAVKPPPATQPATQPATAPA